MQSAFGWLEKIFSALLKFIPRIVIVRATHGGVKWQCGHIVKPMFPGLHVYWPLTTDIEVIVTARQTLAPAKQIAVTTDNHSVVVGVVIVYRIKDIIQAIGRANWDVDTTINDITQAAVVKVISSRTFGEILRMTTGELNDLLTISAKKELSPFGVSVYQCKLTDFSGCRVFRHVMDHYAGTTISAGSIIQD